MPDDDDHTLRISPQRVRPAPPPRVDGVHTESLPLVERPASAASPEDRAYALKSRPGRVG